MALKSWLDVSADSPFSLANLPFGIITDVNDTTKRPAIAIGDFAVDLKRLAQGGAFRELNSVSESVLRSAFEQSTLNEFAALGRQTHEHVRKYLQNLLSQDTSHPSLLKDNQDLQKAILRRSEVQCHVPLAIGDYTDFYAGLNHAYNLGVLLRGPDNALQPNYRHLPVGYHGRASSVQASPTPVRRPNGQLLNPTTKTPSLGPCKKLDLELELAAFLCKPNTRGAPVPVADAAQHIFGYVLMNDWSARDVQAWEYVPLGPFTAKNFATSISPWVVLAGALEPFRVPALEAGDRDELLPYLRQPGLNGLDIDLAVDIVAEGTRYPLSKINASNLLFSFEQMIAHHTITGCNMEVGDLLGSGTISGKTTEALGSLIEMTKNGKEPLELAPGVKRTFLEDGDELILSGVCGKPGELVGFGECGGKILSALNLG